MTISSVGIIGFICGVLINILLPFGRTGTIGIKGKIIDAFTQLKKVLIELILAGMLITLYTAYGLGGQFISYSLMLCFLAACTIWDIETKTISDKLIIACMLTAIICPFFNSDITYLSALLGGIIAGGVFLLISRITKNGIGMGDVKLMGGMGLFLGIERVLAAILFSTVLCGFAGIVLFALNNKNRKKTMPFAPFIFMGTIIAIML